MIAVCPNPYRDHDFIYTRRVLSLLGELGQTACVCPIFADSSFAPPEGMTLCRLRERLTELSHIIVLGGDGTILAVVRELDGAAVPILGINLGTKGFMTSLEPEELDRIQEALHQETPVSTRMMLEARLERDGRIILEERALNDVVLHGYGECIQPTAWADGKKMFAFSGDGLIIATPTGSTGYSMSAGGPIVDPNARAILLTPICAHTLTAKPFVLPPDRKVEVLTEKLTGRRAYLAVDGYSVKDLESGDVLTVQASESSVQMIDLSRGSFFDQLEKLF